MTAIIEQSYDQARRAIEQRMDDLLRAAEAGDLARLRNFRLDSPKFSKFSDEPPFERQDFAEAMEYEAAEFAALDSIQHAFRDVKTDVFGEVAVVTALYDYEAVAGGERPGGVLRVTAVMVDDDGDWKIAHEHLSPLPRATDG